MSVVLQLGDLSLHHQFQQFLNAVEPGVGIVDPPVEQGGHILEPLTVLFQQLALLLGELVLSLLEALQLFVETPDILDQLVENLWLLSSLPVTCLL